MAEINFYANVKDNSWEDDPNNITHGAGSGIGFYGIGRNTSVPVGSVQTTTWTTDEYGTATDGIRLNNTAMTVVGDNSTNVDGEVSVNEGSSITLSQLPNYLCPLNIRFTHTEEVRVQNCALRIFDRVNTDNPASGVTTYVYESRHPFNTEESTYQLSQRGITGTSVWRTFNPAVGQGNVTDMIFTDSPGSGGLNTATDDTVTQPSNIVKEGAAHRSLQHDWYVALSAKPESIGSKTQFGLYFTVEYL